MELWISLAALLVSFLIGIITWLQNRKSNKLQERIVDLETERENQKVEEDAKAILIPRITTDNEWTGKQRHLLSIMNIGKSEARNIRVSINDTLISRYEHVLDDEDEIEILAPNSEYNFIIAKSKETNPKWKVFVHWEDNFGDSTETPRSTETTLII